MVKTIRKADTDIIIIKTNTENSCTTDLDVLLILIHLMLTTSS